MLPWRTCDPAYASADGGPRSGQMRYDAPDAAGCADAGTLDGLCDYRDFAKVDQSAQGRWNGPGGVCVVQRAYPR
jgi:hypothetical protein